MDREVSRDDVYLLAIIAQALLNVRDPASLSPEQKMTSVSAWGAWMSKDFASAYRSLVNLILSLSGVPSGEGVDIASSYDFRLDRSIVSGLHDLTINLDALFAPAAPFSAPCTMQIAISKPGGEVSRVLPAIRLESVRDISMPAETADLPDGRYDAIYELFDPNGKTLLRQAKPFCVSRYIDHRLKALGSELNTLRGAQWRTASQQLAFDSADYIHQLMHRSTFEYVASFHSTLRPMTEKLTGARPSRVRSYAFDIEGDLSFAELLVKDLNAGRDNPFQDRLGNMRLAFRPGRERLLQPFRVFVPGTLQGRAARAAVVALHGAACDENTYLDAYVGSSGVNVFRTLGDRYGYILVSPRSSGPFSGFSAHDVIELTNLVRAVWLVDDSPVFLTGHSMGAIATWEIGFGRPDVWTALAPVAGAPKDVASVPFSNAPDQPVHFATGGKDALLLPKTAREFANLAKEKLTALEHREYPSLDHLSVGVLSLPEVFAFFDRIAEQRTKARSEGKE